MNVFLDYVVKVTDISPISTASTAYLRKVLVLVKPKSEEIAQKIVECTSQAEVETLTDSKCYQLLNAGMSSIYVLPTKTLKVTNEVTDNKQSFFTIIIDPAFDDPTLLEVGDFAGVVAHITADEATAEKFGKATRRCGFLDDAVNLGMNAFHAFGKLLSANSWTSQQYIEVPNVSSVATTNKANVLFDKRVSFCLTEDGVTRLAFFVAGGQAIAAPYIIEELKFKWQLKTANFIALNQPQYNIVNAKLLNQELDSVLNDYIGRGVITNAKIKVTVVEENFTLNATANVAPPTALWKLNLTLVEGF